MMLADETLGARVVVLEVRDGSVFSRCWRVVDVAGPTMAYVYEQRAPEAGYRLDGAVFGPDGAWLPTWELVVRLVEMTFVSVEWPRPWRKDGDDGQAIQGRPPAHR